MSLTAEFKDGLKEAFREAGDVKVNVTIKHVQHSTAPQLTPIADTTTDYSFECVYANYKKTELIEGIERGDLRLYVDYDDIQGIAVNDYAVFDGKTWRVIDFINHYDILMEIQIRL